jgi:hypothetical protein
MPNQFNFVNDKVVLEYCNAIVTLVPIRYFAGIPAKALVPKQPIPPLW